VNSDELQSGNDLEKAFVEWNVLLYRYAYARVQDKELAQDIVQDVFTKAWNSRNTYDSNKSSLKNWLFAILINTIRDHFRKSKQIVEQLSEDVRSGEDVEYDAEIKDAVAFVFKKAQLLTEREQQLIKLRHTAGLSVQEISDVLGMEYSATKVAIHRAIKKLQGICNDNEK